MTHLQDALALAGDAFVADPDFDLHPGFQDAVYISLCAPTEADRAILVFPKRLVALELNSVERVLPISEELGCGSLLGRMLQEVRGFLDDDFDAERVELQLEDWMEDYYRDSNKASDQIVETGRDLLRTTILAATEPQSIVFTRRALDLRNIDEDADDWYLSFIVSVIVAGGPSWHRDSLRNKRRVFWQWWLTENVPAVVGNFG